MSHKTSRAYCWERVSNHSTGRKTEAEPSEFPDLRRSRILYTVKISLNNKANKNFFRYIEAGKFITNRPAFEEMLGRSSVDKEHNIRWKYGSTEEIKTTRNNNIGKYVDFFLII